MQEPEPKQWNRDTAWRQGHVLPPAAAEHFGLSNAADAANTCVVVVSHDCDLANDNLEVEPEIEVIVGRVVSNSNGNFTWGKAPRTLHYGAQRSGAPVVVELVNTNKRSVKKAELAQFAPDAAFSLDGRTLAVLRSWLASRYNRAAFPDSFVDRMKSTKADTKLAKELENHGELVSFVYFDLDGGEHIERGDGDPYSVAIVLDFNPGDDADEAAEKAEAVATAVGRAVSGKLTDPMQIVLRACFPISEDDLTVSKARTLSQWRLEYMTLKSDDEQFGPPNT